MEKKKNDVTYTMKDVYGCMTAMFIGMLGNKVISGLGMQDSFINTIVSIFFIVSFLCFVNAIFNVVKNRNNQNG